jgi:hypothetical protein
MKKANSDYSFLRDDLARTEIYKHKWIESEKAGREIGFATAAFDWITKYGDLWLDHHKKSGMAALRG